MQADAPVERVRSGQGRTKAELQNTGPLYMASHLAAA
jgi:hypothetical protein